MATCTSTTPTMSAFTAQRVREWLGRVGVKTLFIEPGSPWENGYVESFNGKLRDELLARDTRRRLPPPLRSPAFSQCLLHHCGT